jgi:hypothetical protein
MCYKYGYGDLSTLREHASERLLATAPACWGALSNKGGTNEFS